MIKFLSMVIKIKIGENKMDMDDEIWVKAKKGDPSTLSDPRVSTLRDNFSWTPLHYLAWRGAKKIWSHPDFDKVKDKKGRTPKDTWIIYRHRPVTCANFIE